MTKRRNRGKAVEWVAEQQGRHFCQCGCDQPIVVKLRHAEPGRGIPTYLRGHSIRAGGLLNLRGAANPSWKGGRIRHPAGYVLIYRPAHPYAMKMGYVLEHRLALEEDLRNRNPASPYLTEVDGQLYLRPGIIVHHIDGIKDHNDAANLEPLTQSEHAAQHHRERAAIPRSSP